MPLLMLLFVVVPAVELALLIRIGGAIGVLPTLGLIVFTGVLGASLAKQQGLSTLRAIQSQLEAGQMPVDRLADGALILFAAALLLTPGVLTDIVGFACLVPGTRSLIKRQLGRGLARYAQSGRVRVVRVEHPGGPPYPGPGPNDHPRPRGPVIDVEPVEPRPPTRGE